MNEKQCRLKISFKMSIKHGYHKSILLPLWNQF